jgi:hypothetical protein
MTIKKHRIEGLERPRAVAPVSRADFRLGDLTSIESRAVFDDPRMSLYCFDLEEDAAVFVETPDPEALAEAPFYYQAQAERAESVAIMPLAEFHRLADLAPEPGERLTLIHSVGRCGSTLLSKAFGAVPTVTSLSEPDDWTQLVPWRVQGLRNDEWVRRALVSSARWRFRHITGRLVIKTRSEVLILRDLLRECFPWAHHFFLYRDAISWAASVLRLWPADRDIYDAEQNRRMAELWRRTHPILDEYAPTQPNAIQIRVLAWITCMEAYLDMRGGDLPLFALTYRDLTAHPRAILSQVFRLCDMAEVDWQAIDQVLARDSQEGTSYGREIVGEGRALSPANEQEIREIVATRPRLLIPDVRLPGTLETVVSDNLPLG